MHAMFIWLSLFVLMLGQDACAAGRRVPGSEAPGHCYVPGDRLDIRLWEGPAPGAVGDDPCRDIPHLRIYPAAAAAGNGDSAAIVLLPGGGYDRLTNEKEQAPVAQYFSRTLNITTFVLYYRLVQADGTYRYPVPMWDGQRALRLIRHRARELHIDADRLGVFGFSAGGHLASMLALRAQDSFGLPPADAIDAVSSDVAMLGLGYPVLSMELAAHGKSQSRSHLLRGYGGAQLQQLERELSAQYLVSARTPPVFLFVSMDDQRIDPANSVLLADALKAAGATADIHLFAHGAHGVGLATTMAEEQVWPALFGAWLARIHFIK